MLGNDLPKNVLGWEERLFWSISTYSYIRTWSTTWWGHIRTCQFYNLSLHFCQSIQISKHFHINCSYKLNSQIKQMMVLRLFCLPTDWPIIFRRRYQNIMVRETVNMALWIWNYLVLQSFVFNFSNFQEINVLVYLLNNIALLWTITWYYFLWKSKHCIALHVIIPMCVCLY